MNDCVNTEKDEVMLEEVVETTPDMAAAAEEAVEPMMIDLPTALSTVIARTEATSIIVSVINALLDIIQNRENPLTTEELGKIQAVVNAETGKTDALYHGIEEALAKNVAEKAE